MSSPSKSYPVPVPTACGSDEFRLVREVLESLAVALILAFIFKMFLVELFVIPTGSMAPTLMGYHKDVICTTCGHEFTFSASEEFPEVTGQGRRSDKPEENSRVRGGTCPQCGFTMYVDKDNPLGKDYRSYPGDRILVSKYNYDFRDPRRWHVTVFRYPGKAQISYIKRLVGLENETVRIRNGDIFVRKHGEEDFMIQRKPARALKAMLQLVYDNDYVVPKLHTDYDWPRRWIGVTTHGTSPIEAFSAGDDAAASGSTWKVSEDFRRFSTTGNAAAVDTDNNISAGDWLVYRHVVPLSRETHAVMRGERPEYGEPMRPRLITDFNAYVSGLVNNPVDTQPSAVNMIVQGDIDRKDGTSKEFFCYRNPYTMGLNWVGDLAVSCKLQIPADSTTQEFELLRVPAGAEGADPALFQMRLVKGGVVFLCDFDLSTGVATLSIPGVDAFVPVSAATKVVAGSTHDVQFANIDEQLRLWVDGREIAFDGGAVYDRLCEGENAPIPRDRSPTVLDLTPAGFRATVPVTLDHLKIERDIYYIACNNVSLDCDLLQSPFPRYSGHNIEQDEFRCAEILSTPEYWDHFGKTHIVEFTMDKDQFFLLGDNSARSQDSRLWSGDGGIEHYVPRDMLVGEAILVYWPHGLPIPGVPLNLIPNFAQMRLID